MERAWGVRRRSEALAEKADLFRFLSAARVNSPVRVILDLPKCSPPLERPLAAAVWLPTRYDVRLS
jgi:hypothetical protein